jgi:hypothetical protein
MLSANPDLAGQVDTIERIIEETAVPLFDGDTCGAVAPSALPNNTHGYGRINALAAVQRAIAWQSTQVTELPQIPLIRVSPTIVENTCFLTCMEDAVLDIELRDALGKEYFIRTRLQVLANQPFSIDLSQAPSGVLYYGIRISGSMHQSGKLVKI